mgnify:CR=1 FL=1
MSVILVFAPILVALIRFTLSVIFPDDVIGVLPIVNSDPDCVIPTDSTVPELLGVTTVYVIDVEPIEPSLSVVHRNILLSLTDP